MNSKSLTISITVALLVGALGCGKNQDDETLGSEFELSAESGITAISGVADEQNGSSFASYHLKQRTFADLLLPKAYASTCSRAYLSSCVSGVKSATYSDCDISGTLLSLDGSVTLTYSDSGCGLASTGNYVTRTYDYTISGPRGGSLHVFSSAQTDYRGNSISGGGKLIKTASGWEIQILGKNKVLQAAGGSTLMNHSVRTLSNISVTGGLDRASRVVNGGQVEVAHNLANFTAIYTPNNLQWSSSCCHPVSGSISISFDGSVTGTGSIVFNGCGSATISKDDKSRDLSLTYCE
ncbi:MAG: hypothetical protein IT288_08350 [Bdellovibrionales bacterium]|nr:hypothetical protein [Bdellovibrionales bacterium]